MPARSTSRNHRLDLKAGEWVEVRSQAEILETLDEQGRLENLAFMPEMLQYCGAEFRVYKRADKTCEYTQGWSIRRMKDSVHLEGLRCDGTGHDGCQAGCLIFWKEAWLKRAVGNVCVYGEYSSSGSAFGDDQRTLHDRKHPGSNPFDQLGRGVDLQLPGHGRTEIHFSHELLGSSSIYSRFAFWQSRQRPCGKFSRTSNTRIDSCHRAFVPSNDHRFLQRSAGEASGEPLSLHRRHRREDRR